MFPHCNRWELATQDDWSSLFLSLLFLWLTQFFFLKRRFLKTRAWQRRQTGGAQRIFRAVKILCVILLWWIHVTVYLSRPVTHTTPRVNSAVNYGLWVIMMRPCRFINHNKWAALVGDIDNEGGCACVRESDSWEVSTSSSQFLKINLLFEI